MTDDFQIIEVKSMMGAGAITKIKKWEEFVEIAKQNKVDKVYKYGKTHFMMLPTGMVQIKKKK